MGREEIPDADWAGGHGEWAGVAGSPANHPREQADSEEGRGEECRTWTEQTVRDVRGRCGGISGEPHSGAGRK